MIMPEPMKLSTVEKMLPKEVMDVVKLHKPKTYQELRDLIRVEVRENWEKLQEAKTKRAQALEDPVPGEDGAADADGTTKSCSTGTTTCAPWSNGKKGKEKAKEGIGKGRKEKEKEGI